MELTAELIRKHKDVVEATVKAHQSHSKKGKVFTVKQHERKLTGSERKFLSKIIRRNKGFGSSDGSLDGYVTLGSESNALKSLHKKGMIMVAPGGYTTITHLGKQMMAKKSGKTFVTTVFDKASDINNNRRYKTHTGSNSDRRYKTYGRSRK